MERQEGQDGYKPTKLHLLIFMTFIMLVIVGPDLIAGLLLWERADLASRCLGGGLLADVVHNGGWWLVAAWRTYRGLPSSPQRALVKRFNLYVAIPFRLVSSAWLIHATWSGDAGSLWPLLVGGWVIIVQSGFVLSTVVVSLFKRATLLHKESLVGKAELGIQGGDAQS